MTYRKLLAGSFGLALLCSCASLRKTQSSTARAGEESGATDDADVVITEEGEDEDVASEKVEETPTDLGDPTKSTARTILEIQADRDAQNTFPIVQNEFVDQWIRYFTESKNGRKTMETWLGRKARYGDMIIKTMGEDGLPTDLVYLAMIESGFSPKATSPVGAAGVWQFMPQTGKNYGMRINHWYDERRDIVAATHAAARYLKELHQIFGSWYLAAASYNAGEGRTLRVVREQRSRNFWELARGKKNYRAETANYVPKIIAAAMISKNPAQYGFVDYYQEPPLKWETVKVPPGVDLRTIGDIVKADSEMMKLLNPELRRGITPPDEEEYSVRIPIGTSEQLIARKSELKSRKHGFFVEHKLSRGETLSHIARRYGVTVRAVMDINNISNAKRLRAGQRLQIPVDYDGGKSTSRKSARGKRGSWKPETASRVAGYHEEETPRSRRRPSSGGSSHRVRSGDNLGGIARRYGVSINELRSANNISGSKIMVGQRLRIPTND